MIHPKSIKLLKVTPILSSYAFSIIKLIKSRDLNHMSLRKECTCETVLTVLRPLNLKVPPLKVLVKLLLHGKYFYWI